MDDMADEETFEHELAGRMMVFKKTSTTQMLVLQRYAQHLKEQMDVAVEAKDEVALAALVTKLNNITWEAVESRFTDPDDLDFVQDSNRRLGRRGSAADPHQRLQASSRTR